MSNRLHLWLLSTLALAAASILHACNTSTVTPSRVLRVEVAEVDPSAPKRHLFDKHGDPIDLGLVSSIRVEALVHDVVLEPVVIENQDVPTARDTSGYMTFTLPNDETTFREWTKARQQKVMALIVDDQAYTIATIQSELKGTGMMQLPTVIRSEHVKALAYGTR